MCQAIVNGAKSPDCTASAANVLAWSLGHSYAFIYKEGCVSQWRILVSVSFLCISITVTGVHRRIFTRAWKKKLFFNPGKHIWVFISYMANKCERIKFGWIVNGQQSLKDLITRTYFRTYLYYTKASLQWYVHLISFHKGLKRIETHIYQYLFHMPMSNKCEHIWWMVIGQQRSKWYKKEYHRGAS